MDLQQLQSFIYVADLGSFSQAALVLGVGQPTLSKHVRSLEVELRQSLFYRNGRGVSLTEAGKRLLSHARTIQMQFEHARHDVEAVRDTPLGRVTIGLPYAAARHLSIPFIKAFRSRYPMASLCITEGLTIHLYEWLVSGRIDIALLHDPAPSQSLDIVPVREDELLLLSYRKKNMRPVGPPIRMRDIADLPLIIPTQPHPLRMMIEAELAKRALKPTVVMEIDAVATIVKLVSQNEGYAIATHYPVTISDARSNLRMQRIVDPDMKSILAMATSAERPRTTLVAKACELLAATVAEASRPLQDASA
jgi:Transcriptional regulator